MKKVVAPLAMAAVVLFSACGGNKKKEQDVKVSPYQQKADEFAEFELTTDLTQLTEKEKAMLPLLFEAAKIAESIFWKQAYGDKSEVLAKVAGDKAGEKFVNINYGPWERLNANKPFVEGYGAKPAGAQFYPTNMTSEEFDALRDEKKADLYTMVKRNTQGKLEVVPYHVAFEKEVKQMAALVKKASELAEDAGLKKYLQLRKQEIQ